MKRTTLLFCLLCFAGSVSAQTQITSGHPVYTTTNGLSIGTTSSGTPLVIKDSQDNSFNSGLSIIRSVTGQAGYINMVGGAFNLNADSGIPIKFRDGGTTNMTILGNGDVGIGVTSPGYKLDVDGTLNLSASEIAMRIGGTVVLGSNSNRTRISGSGIYFTPNNDATEMMTIKSSGEVGIGTATPANKLAVGISDTNTNTANAATLNIFNENSTVNNIASIAFGQAGSSSNSFSRMGVVYADRSSGSEDQHMFFSTISNGAYGERMRIRSDGNIGIGTTSPVTDFHILASSSGQTFSNLDGLLVENAGSSNGYFVFQTATLGGGKSFSITNAGNVGIGTTTPSAKLHVSGNIYTPLNKTIGYNHGGDNFIYDGTSLGNYSLGWYSISGSAEARLSGYGGIKMFTNRYLRMYIASDGKVGIGTTSPGEKLEVIGNALIDGEIYSKKIKVSQTPGSWPDYVFEPGYQLPTFHELETYINANKHLPGVPSAKEVEDEGQDLGEVQTILLKKIEEMTLQMIEMNKRLEKLEAENKALKEKDK